jgi:Flp pilus assembly protein CpaB
LRRSNRLVVLVGLFLAVVAFVGVFMILNQGGGGGGGGGSADTTEVIATQDIGIGVTITETMVATQKVPVAEFPAGAYHTTGEVINQVARQQILSGQLVTSAAFNAAAASIECPPTDRCVAIQVDQVTGAGTLIQTGDYVDMVVAFNTDGNDFPVVAAAPGASASPVAQGVSAGNTVKLLLQGMQVVGTLLPTPAATPTPGASAAPNQPTLNGQQEIVIVAVPAQYTEVIKFAQTTAGASISLALRSTKDFLDAAGRPISPAPSPDVTTGVILYTLVHDYGVLPPVVMSGIGPSPVP